MAQETTEILKDIIAAEQAEAALYPVPVFPDNTTSVTGFRLRIRVVFANVIKTLQELFDTLKAEIIELLNTLIPHSLRWYANKAKAYQHGFSLVAEKDYYNNSGYTPEQVAASKVVSFSAVDELETANGRVYLRIKLATLVSGALQPLENAHLLGVKAYFKRIKDAGVPLQIDSLPADKLKMKWKIYYDASLIDGQGVAPDGTKTVENAIKEYLEKLPFNGLYVLNSHIDYVQKITGVVNPVILECLATYGTLAYSNIQDEYKPDSGYLRFYETADLQLEFIAHDAIQ